MLTPILFYGNIYVKFNKVKGYIETSCENLKVSKSLVIAVCYVESKFNSNAVSNKGAVGVMQIMPSTAKFVGERYGVDNYNNLRNACVNVEIGVRYLKYLLDKYGSEIIALSAYNAGEGNVIKWLENGNLTVEQIKYKETKLYVKKVLKIKKLAYLKYA